MKKNVIVIIFSFLSFMTCSIALAQPPDVSRATRELDRPIQRQMQEKLRPIPKKVPEQVEEEKKAPQEFEGPKFFVKKIKLEGCESFPPEDFSKIVNPYENREVTLDELNILSKEIEREYLRRGIITSCIVPPQEIKDGVVVLVVVEARMGELDIKDHKWFKKNRLAYYWRIKPGEKMRYDVISRSLQIANKNPDREARATLYPGKKPKTTSVTLDVESYFPVHATATYDNEGVTSTGRYRKGVGGRHNNLLGLDDMLLAGYLYGDAFRDAYAYHTIPVTPFGTSIIYGYYNGRAWPQKEFTPLNLISRAENSTFSIHQDIFQKDEFLGEIYGTFDAKDKSSTTYAGTLSRDRLRILRAGGGYIMRQADSLTVIRPEFSQGINGFGALRRNPYTSRGAKNTFSKGAFQIQHRKSIAAADDINLTMNINLKGQLASTRLTSAEQAFLGGIDSVRGYPAGDYQADSGFQANCELLVPAFFMPDSLKLPYAARPFKEDVTGVLFYDYGYGRKRFPLPFELETANMASVGAGFRIKFFDQALVRCEWGFPIHDKTITESGDSRFHLMVNFEDQIPREAKRIGKLIENERIDKMTIAILDDEIAKKESMLRKILFTELATADTYYGAGDLESAKAHYEKAISMSQSAYAQVSDYIRGRVELLKKLKENDITAANFYKQGECEKAKEIWAKIIEDAKFSDLTIEIG